MCGIVGYVAEKTQQSDYLFEGLRRLEYRGYDSCGLALSREQQWTLYKNSGALENLHQQYPDLSEQAYHSGMGHTRWATHGEPSSLNAHPHRSYSGRFFMVHNGVVESYADLQIVLKEQHIHSVSETDSEILLNYIDWKATQNTLDVVLPEILKEIRGMFALVIAEQGKRRLYFLRRGLPLFAGTVDDAWMLASDLSPLAGYARDYTAIADESCGYICADAGLRYCTMHHDLHMKKLDLVAQDFSLSNFPHYMLKEIHEQPGNFSQFLEYALREDMSLGLSPAMRSCLQSARNITIVACGTSYHAGLSGQHFFSSFTDKRVQVRYSSEVLSLPSSPDDLYILISQSGETADTNAVLTMLKKQGVPVLGICNVPYSFLAREADEAIFLRAGPEISVASTKAFTAQIRVVLLLALQEASGRLKDEMIAIPQAMQSVIDRSEEIDQLAAKCAGMQGVLFLGRQESYPLALEGALKMKELAYLFCEGIPAGEMKHGSLALIDDKTSVVLIAANDLGTKNQTTVAEIVARKGHVIHLGRSVMTSDLVDNFVLPETAPELAMFPAVVSLQLLAYYTAVHRGCEIDKPRNLAKSVTVE